MVRILDICSIRSTNTCLVSTVGSLPVDGWSPSLNLKVHIAILCAVYRCQWYYNDIAVAHLQ
jgi:hypothetical protein